MLLIKVPVFDPATSLSPCQIAEAERAIAFGTTTDSLLHIA